MITLQHRHAGIEVKSCELFQAVTEIELDGLAVVLLFLTPQR